MSLRSAPSIKAEMYESPLYNVLGAGLTDRVFLLGHADGLTLNDPLQVSSMNEALRAMNSDVNSPLVHALLEAFLAGARDIWVVAVAPMSEYEPDLELRDQAYYETYRARLATAYQLLKYWDMATFTVPVDAPFNSTVDFLGDLAEYCVEAFNLSGEIHLGIMGTRGNITADVADKMAEDGRLGNLGDGGRFVGVFTGDGTYNFQVLETAHVSSVAATVAGQMATLPYDRGITYLPLKNVARPTGPDLDKQRISNLAEAGINYVGRNTKGKRGRVFQTVAYTDNTLASDGSDYWSFVQMRLVASVSAEVRGLGQRRLGTVGYGLFKNDVRQFLLKLYNDNVIREYQVQFQQDPEDPFKVYVDIVLTPYFGIREIAVNVFVGPSVGA